MMELTSILQEESCDLSLLNHIKQEAPYDSGYFSPDSQQSVVPTGQMVLLSQTQASPKKPSALMLQRAARVDPFHAGHLQKPPVYEDVGLSAEWEKDFFSNFEDNLFSIDLDDQVLDDILKSPKGKVALNEMINSPKGKAMMNSPKGKMLKDRMRLFDTPPDDGRYTTVLDRHGILSPTDTNKPGITPMKPDAQRALKMSKRKLSLGTINQPLKPSFVTSLPSLARAPPSNENEAPVTWPSQERLKFARNHFKDILKKAVQKVEIAEAAVKAQQQLTTLNSQKTNRRQKGKTDKYPQLSKALSRPSVTEPSSGESTRRSDRKGVSSGMLLSGCQLQSDWYNPDEEEDDDDWRGDLPFTGFKQAVKRRKRPGSGQAKRRKTSHKH